MATHSPLPWSAGIWMGACHIAEHGRRHPGPPACKYDKEFIPMEADNGAFAGIVSSEPGVSVVSTSYDELNMLSVDAAFIVRACNSHDDLLAALKAIVAADDSKSLVALVDVLPAARAAIAKAEAQ